MASNGPQNGHAAVESCGGVRRLRQVEALAKQRAAEARAAAVQEAFKAAVAQATDAPMGAKPATDWRADKQWCAHAQRCSCSLLCSALLLSSAPLLCFYRFCCI